MSQFIALALSSLFLFCAAIAPLNVNDTHETSEITYHETVYAPEGGIVPLASETQNVIINYSTRTSTTHTLAARYPTYSYSPAIGACAAVAGGNVVGFYDRYDENLIPNHTSGTVFGTTYLYSSEDASVRSIIDSLYSYMGSSTAGTTENQFLDGMTNFCKDKGKTISFSSCMKSGSLNYATAQSYLDNNQPIILFLSGYNVGFFMESANKDEISYYVSDANHIMVAFGYKTYTYTGATNGTYYYFSVASGIVGNTSGLFNISYQTKINDALAVNIN